MGMGTVGYIQLEQATELASTLSCSTRLSILIQLRDRPSTVREVCAALGLSQSLVSHHLAGLRAIGAAKSVRRKQSMVYRLGPTVHIEQRDGDLEVTLYGADGRTEVSLSICAETSKSESCTQEPLTAKRSSSPST